MHIDQARVRLAALKKAIEEAEQAGSTEVDLRGVLDAELAQAVDELRNGADTAPGAGARGA